MKKHLFYVSLSIFLIFLLPLVIFAFWKSGNTWGLDPEEWPPQVIVGLGWLSIFSAAAAFGSLGSAIRYFLGPPQRVSIYDESIHAFIAMHFIGATFGIVLLLLFTSNIISGALFPSISAGRLEPFAMRLGTWAEIMIWAFVAGYYEYFLPNILSRIVQKTDDDAHKKNNPNKETQ